MSSQAAAFDQNAFFAALDKQLATKAPEQRRAHIDSQIANWRDFEARLHAWALCPKGKQPFDGQLNAIACATMVARLAALKERHTLARAA